MSAAKVDGSPHYVASLKNGKIQCVLPLYIKQHSYGEYVFDWSWANAYAQSGLNYYPKLLNAIPFTPATGPRIGFAPTLDETQKSTIVDTLFKWVRKYANEHHFSGLHCLFPQHNDLQKMANCGLLQRTGYQFHWFNRANTPYNNFDDFLSEFVSRKRKSLKKERCKVGEQNIRIEMKRGEELSQHEWDIFYALYHHTYLKRSGNAGYLGRDFFHLLAKTMPTQILVACAYEEDDFIAAAFYLRDQQNLYGRYWGSKKDIDGLHFEACYYQGIEYAIAHQLKRFDPGAQGEHKIQRGFTPIRTTSYHWLAHPQFHEAIDHFLIEESQHVEQYITDSRNYLPFKEGIKLVDRDILVKF